MKRSFFTNRFRLVSLCTGVAAVVFLSIHFHRQFYSQDSGFLKPSQVFSNHESERELIILFWTPYYGEPLKPGMPVHTEAIKSLENCPVKNCHLTSNRTLLAESDAVLFCMTDIDVKDLPDVRKSNQYFIFYNLESPVHSRIDFTEVSKNYFNLTMTYKLDSDVISDSYFQFYQPKPFESREEYLKFWKRKTKFGMALISNCLLTPSGRQIYLTELSSFVPVDIYGGCGSFKCGSEKECNGLVSSYKFYFAFENSICKDYVTEKVHRAFTHGAIPVVYGGADYAAIFPPNSFINVLDFKQPSDLAKYLLAIAENADTYELYFKWKYQPLQMLLPPFIQPMEISWCKLCRILHEKQRKHIVIADANQWFRTDSKCSTPILNVSVHPPRWMANPLVERTGPIRPSLLTLSHKVIT